MPLHPSIRQVRTRTLDSSQTRQLMAKFITIGYGDEAGYDRTEASVRESRA